MSGSFSEALKPLIETAPWYWLLLHLRDELTHLATGGVHLKPETGLVWYVHHRLKEGDKPLVIEDTFGWLYEMIAEVNRFLGAAFHHLNGTLADKPIFQICGMVQGRVLHRWLSPIGESPFDSGACGAGVWFEQPDGKPPMTGPLHM